MSAATVTAGLDSYVPSDHPDLRYGQAKSTILRSASPISQGLLWFKSPVPAGATVLSAALRMYGKGAWSSLTVNVQAISSSWVENRVTYNNRPGAAGTTATLAQANTDGLLWSIDVTALVQAIADGGVNYGFKLTTPGTRAEFYSLNSATNRPELYVTWSDGPGVPHTLSPSGSRSVSIAKPVLRFDYIDVSGTQLLTAVQVQVDAAGNFVTPGFDSGTVAAALPQLDLTTTAYAGLSAGASTQWRVRVKDAAGLWSAWSDPASFTRTAKATLTITNPAVSPNNFVSEPTPPFAWTFTGAAAYRVQVSLDSDPAHPIVDTGKISGTTLTWTPPASVLTDQSATYRLTVQAWDSVSRESTPGDPTYVEASRAFTFHLSGTVAAVTSLTATQDPDGPPSMVLDWNRSTAPDSFTIIRDGKRVDSGLLPSDLLVSGTHYEYTDVSAPPNVPHVWSVQAVVNGVTSASNPTQTDTIYTDAVWLTDPDTGKLVSLIGVDQMQFDMPENAGTYAPAGADAVVRIVQGRRGLEGTVSGRIANFAGITAQTGIAAMLYFKSLPDNELRLLINSQALRVTIGAVVLAPVRIGPSGDRDCTFSFWSLDGPS